MSKCKIHGVEERTVDIDTVGCPVCYDEAMTMARDVAKKAIEQEESARSKDSELKRSPVHKTNLILSYVFFFVSLGSCSYGIIGDEDNYLKLGWLFFFACLFCSSNSALKD